MPLPLPIVSVYVYILLVLKLTRNMTFFVHEVSFTGQVVKGNGPLSQLFLQVILFQVAVKSGLAMGSTDSALSEPLNKSIKQHLIIRLFTLQYLNEASYPSVIFYSNLLFVGVCWGRTRQPAGGPRLSVYL